VCVHANIVLSRPFEAARLDAELKLAGEYGLRNKREIWYSPAIPSESLTIQGECNLRSPKSVVLLVNFSLSKVLIDPLLLPFVAWTVQCADVQNETPVVFSKETP
jgi:hypothetical protein